MVDSNESVTTGVQSDIVEDQETSEQSASSNPEELSKRLLEVSKEAKRRRLEVKEIRDEKLALEERLKQLEQEKLQEQGNFKKLYEETQTQLKQKEDQFTKTIGNYALKSLKNAVETRLVKSGCARTDAVLALLDSQVKGLDYDDEFNPDAAQVEELVKLSQEQYPEFYKQNTPKIKDAAPAGRIPGKQVAEMSVTEIKAALAAMDKK